MEEENKPKKFHYTYEITNVNNGMKYIGVRSCYCLPCFDPYMSSSKYVKKAMKEDEHAHFVKVVLSEFPTRKEAVEHEMFLHEKFDVDRNQNFYNRAKQAYENFNVSHLSGEKHPMYGKHHSDETKRTLSIASTGKPGYWKGKKLPKSAKEKISKARLGTKRSTEAREKQRNTMLGQHAGEKNPRYGKPVSPETREKLGKANRKRTRSLEQRERMSNAQKGENAPQYGKPLSQETRDKIGEKSRNRKPLIYITPVGEFASAEKASKVLQCSISTVLRRCRDNFEGYFTKPARDKKGEFEKLHEDGYKISKISKMLEVSESTLRFWRDKLNLTKKDN
jgi:hypothetical protein